MKEKESRPLPFPTILSMLAVLAGVLLTRWHSYLLFHCVTEFFSIVVAWGCFLVAWHTRRFAKENFLLVLGISAFFTGSIDLIHTLAYKGMNVFPDYDANLPTQLWIGARYLQSFSLLCAALVINIPPLKRQPLNEFLLVLLLGVVTISLILAIFGGFFPVCYVEGVGLTTFKKVSEYIICALFLISGLFLWRVRDRFHGSVLNLLLASIATMIAAELAFTLYVGVYGFFNLLGHLAKIAAYYFLYRSIVITGLETPHALLFKELKDSEERWQFALEGAGDGVWDWNAQTNKVFFSKQWKAMLGFDEHEIGDSLDEWKRRVHPDDLERVYAAIERHFTGETPVYVSEHRLLCKDGSYKWILGRGKVISRLEGGKPLRVIGTHTDISERKVHEERLECQSRLLAAINRVLAEALTAQSSEAVALTCLKVAEDLTDSRFGFIGEVTPDNRFSSIAISNPGWEACGIPGEKAVPMIKNMTIRGIWGDVILKGCSLVVNDPASYAGRAGLPPDHPPIKSFLGIPLKEDGRLFGMIGVANNESGYSEIHKKDLEALSFAFVEALKRKRAEETIKRYEFLSKNISEVILFVSPDGRIMDVNDAAVETYGYPKSKMLDMHLGDLFDPKGGDLVEYIMEKGFAAGLVMEAEHIRADGTAFPVEMSFRGVVLDGEQILVSVIRDISDRKRVEAQQRRLEAQLAQAQKMEAIGVLAGGIAHDFNNILGIILGYAEIAAFDIALDSRARKSLDEIMKATHRAKDLVKQILTFSRRSEKEQKPLQMVPVVKECLKLLRASLPSTVEIQQEIQVGPGEDTILGDITQIHQVLMNLAANASHAMSEKGGVLRVNLSQVSFTASDAGKPADLEPGEYVKLSVGDTGHGIEPHLINRIFEPYFTTKEPGKGTGLGLAVVHGIVKEHRGAVTVYSEVGKGTIFHLYFPRFQAEPLLVNEKAANVAGGTERVLLVDDEPALVSAVGDMLDRLGYRVTGLTSSTEALDLFLRAPLEFDLVITDYTMPNMTGTELAGKILEIRPDIPVILCSGFNEIINEEEARKKGISAFVMKPVSLAGLTGVIREVLSRGSVM